MSLLWQDWTHPESLPQKAAEFSAARPGFSINRQTVRNADTKIIDVKRDGNCFYSALSLCAFLSTNGAQVLRKLINGEVYRRWKYFQNFIPNATKQFYFKIHSKEGTYATSIQIQAACNILKVGICVNINNGKQEFWPLGMSRKGLPVAILQFQGPLDSGHFKAVLPEGAELVTTRSNDPLQPHVGSRGQSHSRCGWKEVAQRSAGTLQRGGELQTSEPSCYGSRFRVLADMDAARDHPATRDQHSTDLELDQDLESKSEQVEVLTLGDTDNLFQVPGRVDGL